MSNEMNEESEVRQDSPPPGESQGGAGGLDVQGMLRQASMRVRVDQLVRNGTKFIAILSREKIDQLINQAVRTMVEHYRGNGSGFSDVPLSKVEAESKREFRELFSQVQAARKATGDLEYSKSALDAELQELHDELEREKDGRLDEELAQALKNGYEEFERELNRHVGRVFDNRKGVLEASGSPEAVAELKRVEDEIRPIIARLASEEWERAARSGGAPKKIALLQRRIEKLYAHIAAMEQALRTISQSKVYSNQQINNLLRQLGLLEEDRFYEKKREMLKIVLSANQQIRKEAKELADKGVTLSSPRRVA